MIRRFASFVVVAIATFIAVALWAPHGAAASNGSVTGTIMAKGLSSNANIVVSLHAPGLSSKPSAGPVQLDQNGKVFMLHVLPVVQGATVRFLNSDPFEHNVFSPEGRYDLGSWPQGQSKGQTFSKPGVYTQLCRIHPEMEAFVIVLDTPYFATTDQKGAFQIPDVPPGRYTLEAWSEKLKEARQPVTVTAGTPTTIQLTLGR